MPDGLKNQNPIKACKFELMKKILPISILCTTVLFCTSCNVFKKQKEGCPTNGKNIGAEKLLSGEKVPKAKKFRS